MISLRLKNTSQIYPSIFSFVIFVLLISFVPYPELDLARLATNFRWRRELINMHAHFKLKLGDRVYNSVVIGEGGWFFLSGDGNMVDYQNTDPLNKKKLANLQLKLDL